MQVDITYDMFRDNTTGLTEQHKRAIWEYCTGMGDKRKTGQLLFLPSYWEYYHDQASLFSKFHRLLSYDDWNLRKKALGSSENFTTAFVRMVKKNYPMIKLKDGGYLVFNEE